MDQQNYFLADRPDTHSNQGSSSEDEDLPGDEFICGICRDLYLDPRKLIPCHHIFCETCLRRLNQAQISNCPICRGQIMDTLPEEDLRNQIMETYPQYVQDRAEAEQQSNVYSLDLPTYTPPSWMELFHTIFDMRFQINLNLGLVLRFGLREVLLLLMMVLMEIFRLIVRIREDNWHSIPNHMAMFFTKILMLIATLFFFR